MRVVVWGRSKMSKLPNPRSAEAAGRGYQNDETKFSFHPANR